MHPIPMCILILYGRAHWKTASFAFLLLVGQTFKWPRDRLRSFRTILFLFPNFAFQIMDFCCWFRDPKHLTTLWMSLKPRKLWDFKHQLQLVHKFSEPSRVSWNNPRWQSQTNQYFPKDLTAGTWTETGFYHIKHKQKSNHPFHTIPGGGFKYFLFSSLFWRNYPIWLIFFRWVETTTSIINTSMGCLFLSMYLWTNPPMKCMKVFKPWIYGVITNP